MTKESLEDYLAGEYHQDIEDIRELEETLERAANVFIYAQHDNGAWPYSYRQSDTSGFADRVSHGTQAMIAVALARMGRRGGLASGHPARLKLTVEGDARAALHLGVARLSDALVTGLESRSFGRKDPVTLSHVTDLLSATNAYELESHEAIRDAVTSAVDELWEIAALEPRAAVSARNANESLLRNLPNVYALFPDDKLEEQAPKEPHRLPNAFVPLRIARSITVLEQILDRQPPENFRRDYRRFFESTLHEQLSFSEIPDSRFDPAELIFCLEGLMLIASNAVDDRLFERVLNVLEAKQDESAHWRPNRPIYATEQGMTMLPVSVEGAVSLMRSISVKDRHKDFQPLSIRAIPMTRRFWKWLQARAIRFERGIDGVAAHQQSVRDAAGVKDKVRPGIRELTGWHSEHVNDPELIHLWDTSQVAEFMLAYRELLQRGIAGRTLRLSRLKINRPARERPSDWLVKWEKSVANFDPRPGAKEGRTYHQVGTAFVHPWAEERESKASSMLLYGPPGTGKSTLGEKIADALGMRMVTVTVSDFLGRGGAYVEARAKAIFQTLEAQFDTVILFDEIDAFLLDRDSERYEKQDTLFQFLTPGMLTKINDLHKLGRSIFIIATNYANRIDPAIQRKGRIDQHYLLHLPDRTRRAAILKEQMGLSEETSLPNDLLEDTVFFGYSDLKSIVDDAGEGSSDPREVLRLANEDRRKPKVVMSYLGRIKSDKEGNPILIDFPEDEFLGIFDLWSEVNEEKAIGAMLEEYKHLAPIAMHPEVIKALDSSGND